MRGTTMWLPLIRRTERFERTERCLDRVGDRRLEVLEKERARHADAQSVDARRIELGSNFAGLASDVTVDPSRADAPWLDRLAIRLGATIVFEHYHPGTYYLLAVFRRAGEP